jgi:hypothetical protein
MIGIAICKECEKKQRKIDALENGLNTMFAVNNRLGGLKNLHLRD